MADRKKEIVTLSSTIWTLKDLADWLGISPAVLQERLAEKEVRTLHLGNRYSQRLIRLEDLFKAEKP